MIKRLSAALSISLALLPLAGTAVLAQEAHLEILRGKFQTQLEEIVGSYEGVAGIHILDLTTGDRLPPPMNSSSLRRALSRSRSCWSSFGARTLMPRSSPSGSK